jgi:S-disulfanyl-L-cysteine oxidoreductase SoxD
MFDRALLSLILFSACVVQAAEQVPAKITPQHNDIARVATSAEISLLDISVLPNGDGLPSGRGTAREGQAIYVQHCAACHGMKGEGIAEYPALVGGRGSLASAKPVLTVGSYWPYTTTIFDYIRRAMPYERPGSLRPNEVYALTAWLLNANAIIDDDKVIDQATLPQIRMPNRDGFIADPRPDVGRKEAASSTVR